MYRWAKPADKQAVMDLWAMDFESYEPYFSWYFSNIYRPELTLCDVEGEQLAAALQLAPYTLALHGRELPVCYMVGVITDPAYRRQGRGQALLRQAHSWLQANNYAAALLYTDIPDFYAPLGYRHCYSQQTLTLPARPAPAPPPWRHGADIPALDVIYQRMTARYDGYILRGKKNWRNYLDDHACDGARLLLDERAYLLYSQQQDKLHIIELGFSDQESLLSALNQGRYLAAQAGLPLIWHAPVDAPALLPHIPAACWQPRPFVMALPLDARVNFRPLGRPLWINEYT